MTFCFTPEASGKESSDEDSDVLDEVCESQQRMS